jgi:hypothetical protein
MKNKFLLIAMGFTMITHFIAAQVPSYVPTNGLVAYWPFNGNAIDESGNGNNGNNFGATPTTDRNGSSNSALSFNGLNNYISVPYSSTIGVQQEISVSFWVYFNGGSCGPRIMQCPPWGQCGGYTIATSSTSNSSRYFYTNFENCTSAVVSGSSPSLPGLSWHHVVWTASGLTGVSRMYFDGVLVDTDITNSFFTSINYLNRPLTIGNIDPNSCDWFGGYLDDIGIWNRILTPQEITNLYNSVSSNECLTMTINTGVLNTNPVTYTSTVSIYPNPANDHITIDCGNLANVSGWSIKITNMVGQEVFNQPMNTQQFYVPLNSWTGQGVYFVKIINAQNEVVNIKKIILQ